MKAYFEKTQKVRFILRVKEGVFCGVHKNKIRPSTVIIYPDTKFLQ